MSKQSDLDAEMAARPKYQTLVMTTHDARRFQAACAAMQGLMAGGSFPFTGGHAVSIVRTPEAYAAKAVKYADALLRELSKEEGK